MLPAQAFSVYTWIMKCIYLIHLYTKELFHITKIFSLEVLIKVLLQFCNPNRVISSDDNIYIDNKKDTYITL